MWFSASLRQMGGRHVKEPHGSCGGVPGGDGVSNAMAQEPSTSWAVPEGARVTVDRQSGSVSIVVPREISNRVGRDARFEQWRKTPYAGTGPFPATRVEDPTLPTHTLYYPAGLAGIAAKLPVILWANGGCRNTSIEFTAFLGELASRGYFIVAHGRNDVPFAAASALDGGESCWPAAAADARRRDCAGRFGLDQQRKLTPGKQLLQQAGSRQRCGSRTILRWRAGLGSIERPTHQSRCGAQQQLSDQTGGLSRRPDGGNPRHSGGIFHRRPWRQRVRAGAGKLRRYAGERDGDQSELSVGGSHGRLQ